MNTPNALKTPQTETMSIAWRRYCLIKALECRRLGSEWVEAKRQALMYARAERQLMRYHKGNSDVA